MKRLIFLVLTFCAGPALSGPLTERDGWEIMPTGKGFDALVEDVLAAVEGNGMGVVTQAGPTGAAKARGVDIPGNRVIGVFNNIVAVEVLGLSTAAMIEAPIRLYVTENEDETATLSYKTPSLVLAPYFEEGGARLEEIAGELDTVFDEIAADATE
ncbi:DUF302 domain-containing protein [Algicella marina]|uniref:DUF302 domain-containing protein n=1 Tax=Algicella marina TaxID=2683284 RepID=A0A6P1SZT8_9RHOB|nr:DUF302 domain-containing protein [Algicella marina]QHQ33752.1 DUF302 domain-containing protein [Algicella marina]